MYARCLFLNIKWHEWFTSRGWIIKRSLEPMKPENFILYSLALILKQEFYWKKKLQRKPDILHTIYQNIHTSSCFRCVEKVSVTFHGNMDIVSPDNDDIVPISIFNGLSITHASCRCSSINIQKWNSHSHHSRSRSLKQSRGCFFPLIQPTVACSSLHPSSEQVLQDSLEGVTSLL